MTKRFQKNGLTRLEKMRIQGMTVRNGSIENRQLRKLCDSIDAASSVVDHIIRGLDPSRIKIENANDLYKLMNSQAGLAKARTELERTMLETQGLFGEAAATIVDELRTHLAGYPEILSEVLRIAQEAAYRADPRNLGDDEDDFPKNSNTPDAGIG